MSYKITGTYGTMYYAENFEKTVQYYKDVLKLKPRFESPEWTEFDIDGHGLCLHGTAHAKNKKDIPDQGILIISVTGLKEMVKDLKSKNVEFLGDIKEVHPGAFSAEFKDPSGNWLSLYEDTNPR